MESKTVPSRCRTLENDTHLYTNSHRKTHVQMGKYVQTREGEPQRDEYTPTYGCTQTHTHTHTHAYTHTLFNCHTSVKWLKVFLEDLKPLHMWNSSSPKRPLKGLAWMVLRGTTQR